MSYQRERDLFIARATRIGVPIDIVRALLRAATTHHRLSERECNGDDWCEGDTARAKRIGLLVDCPNAAMRSEAWCPVCSARNASEGHDLVTRSSVAMERLEGRLRKLMLPSGVSVDFQGDPRGYTVRLVYDNNQHVIGVPPGRVR